MTGLDAHFAHPELVDACTERSRSGLALAFVPFGLAQDMLRQAQHERKQAGETASAGQVIWLGKGVDYAEALALQHELVSARAEGHVLDTVLLLEHASVYTAGRRAVPEHVVGALPAPLIVTDRGGQTTFHGPGQLVGYPIVGLAERGLGPRRYVRALEDALIGTLGHFGIEAHVEPGITGVWAGDSKIAAIGVRITRGVAMHGFALNVSTDLSYYESIVPCGIADRGVTSMAAVLGATPDSAAVRDAVADALGHCLGIAWAE